MIASKSRIRYVSTLSKLAAAFNSKPELLMGSQFLSKSGLFKIPQLAEYTGFFYLQESAILESSRLVDECCSRKRHRKLVEVFDNLSNSLCKVADLAEFVRMVHSNPSYVSAANEACTKIGTLVEKLNTNRELYDSLKNVVENGDCTQTDDVDDHVAKLFLFDFEQSGIHLCDKDRERVAQLNEEILTIGQKYLLGTNESRAINLNKLPTNFKHPFIEEGDNAIIGNLYADSSSELVREIAYKAYLHPNADQEQLLKQLLRHRHEMASLCGFRSYAHRATRGSLAESTTLIDNFLNELSNEVKSEAEQDFKIMSKLKSGTSDSVIHPWDVSYLMSVARRSKLSENLSQNISSYFSLGTVMDGLSNLFRNIFGISLKLEECTYGELWSENVYKLVVIKESGDELGYIYCDFFEEAHKTQQDCHFTIRGGKRLEDGSYQNPVVVLHLNLRKPTWSTPSLLSLSQVENLFHEMGHAIHSMLARTKYQHVTGTRCSTDFAEVPSILMEFFANDARVLHNISKHYKTGESLPKSVIEKILASKNLFSAAELQLQIFYSTLDQRLHDTGEWFEHSSTTDVLRDVQNEHYCLPHTPNTAWQLRFGHLVGYGAKYYSYLISRAVASWIWQKYFNESPFNRDAGEKFEEEVLRHGGGKPPKKMVAEFLGKDINSKNLVTAIMSDLSLRKSK